MVGLLITCSLCHITVINTATATTYYCDPVDGDTADNDGLSTETAWGTLESVFTARKIQRRQYPDGDVSNPEAPVAQSDTIKLLTGYHGLITNYSGWHNNEGTITIEAETDNDPCLGYINVEGFGYWVFKGLTVSPELAGAYPNSCIKLANTGSFGNSNHVTIENCTISTASDTLTDTWDQNDWAANMATGIDLRGGNAIIRNNNIFNVAHGILAGGYNSLIEYNTINKFCLDGLRVVGGNDQTWQYNTVRNSLKVNDNHDDGMQVYVRGGILRLTIRGNRFYYEPGSHPYAKSFQGIFCRGGDYDYWTIENNLIFVDHYHGISIDDPVGTVIVNNTIVRPPGSNRTPWIKIYYPENAANVIIRNNIAYSYSPSSDPNITKDHNIQLGESGYDPTNVFNDYANLDFTLKAGSPAVNVGTTTNTPSIDILGNTRDNQPDVGCYEYIPSDPNGQVYTLSVTAAHGSVTKSPDKASYSYGETVTLQAVPDAGYNFVNWSGDISGGSNPMTFIMDSDKSVTATFAVDTYTLTITSINGSVIKTPNKASYSHGEVVALEAIPNTGYHFLNWTGDASGSDSLTAITMNNNKEVVATFAINIYTLDITTVGGSVVKTPDKASYDHGETVTLRAIPDTGYSFLSWSGDLSGSNNPATLTMNTDKSIAANFTVVNPDETAPSISNCSPAPGSIQVPLNNLMTLDATDDNTGIDPDSIVIKINDEIIYSGNQAEYTSIHGTCRRSGTNANYKFVYQPENPFDFDQVVAVSVTASDIAGNTLNQYAYSFKTEMRSFGKNIKVNSDTEAPDKGGVVTAADAEGNIWIVWHAGLDDERDIYISKLTAGTEYFGDSIRVTRNEYDQCNPALAVGADGSLYVVWQDNRRGNWDIYASVSSDGVEWSNERRITDSNDNQINPDIAVDNQSPNRAYAVWQDDGAGNYDIYITSSNNGFITETTSRITSNNTNQTEPAIAVGPGNVVYVVWIDYRNGRTDIYGASSDYSTWTNVPVVSNPANQSSPALACEPGKSVLHLLWMDDSGGNMDIYHAMTNGLPDSSLTGTSIIDDTSGADQLEPTIIATSDMQDRTKIFACWQDKRYVTGHSSDTDIFFAELSHGYAGTNILIGDDRTNSNQVGPAIGTDRYCQPYIVWIDDRDDLPGVYCAGTTYMSPIPTVSTDVSALSGAIVGTDPSAIRDIGDVCVVIPPRAYPTDVKITITEIQNPPAFSMQCLSAYDFGPSGIEFSQPVRVIMPYNVPNSSRSASAYWYNSLTTALSQQGITDIEDIIISSTIHALSFRTTHFTPFYVVSGDDSGGGDSGGGGGGGCAISPISEVTFTQFILPYAGLAAAVVILKLRDRRNRKNNRAIRDGY